jgi:hypothetical protein
MSFTLVFTPRRGMITVLRRHIRQRWVFAQQMLLAHLLQYEGTPAAMVEGHVAT